MPSGTIRGTNEPEPNFKSYCFAWVRSYDCGFGATAAMTFSMKPKNPFILPSLFFVLVTVVSVAAQDQGSSGALFLRDGDRVIFYGDSITAQRFYTRDVEEFLLTRYPALKIEFFCAGVSGDTVYGGYAKKWGSSAKDKPMVFAVPAAINRDALPR